MSMFRMYVEKSAFDGNEQHVFTSLVILRVLANPPVRGFFCDDETIRYPHKKSTVSRVALVSFCAGLPIITMCITEILLAIRSTESTTPLYLFGKRIPLWLMNTYETIGIFLFGAGCSQLITDIPKFVVGRLRPHFYDVCDPNVDCSLSMYQYQYITNYTCRGTSSKVTEARRSFPSAHASNSAYAMVYLALYIQARVHWKGSALLKHAAQFGCIAISWGISVSRVTDNMHHWSDVAVGLVIGTVAAVLTSWTGGMVPDVLLWLVHETMVAVCLHMVPLVSKLSHFSPSSERSFSSSALWARIMSWLPSAQAKFISSLFPKTTIEDKRNSADDTKSGT